jgi:hypothetical protein
MGEIRISDVYQQPGIETAVYDWFTSPEGKQQQEHCVGFLGDEVVRMLATRTSHSPDTWDTGYCRACARREFLAARSDWTARKYQKRITSTLKCRIIYSSELTRIHSHSLQR